MNKKIFSGWSYFPLVLLGLQIFGCSADRAEKFVRYHDPDVVAYQEHSAETVRLDNDQSGQVNYLKIGDSEPIRVGKLHGGEQPTASRDLPGSLDEQYNFLLTPELLSNFIDRNAPDELAFLAVQKLAQPLIDKKDWTGAASVFEKYRNKFPLKDLAFSRIISILSAPDQAVIVTNLGSEINTSAGEYKPVISSNGKKMFFARDCGTCAGGEDIYVASLSKAGIWGGVEKFGQPLSTEKNEIPLALSADGNTLAVFGNYANSLGRGDVFHIDRTAKSWTPPQHYPAPLNSEYFDSDAAFSADGNAILFVSDRPGGIGEYHPKGELFHGDYNGNTDIYVFIPDSTTGGRVINLGPTINTPYSEYSPYLHPDGKTLYFSSNGLPGLGGMDLFKSTRLSADSWTDWSVPENLGKEINTTYNDWGYQFTTAGDRGYFSADNRIDGYGGSDIFSVTLPGHAQPSPVITVSGTITDPSGNFLAADVAWSNTKQNKVLGHATSDPQTGEYVIHLPVGGEYTYYAEKTGYMGESEHIDLKDELGYREFYMDITLYPVVNKFADQPRDREMVAMIHMNNIFFDFDKAKLRDQSILELDRWVKMLQENPSVSIEIDGHTDSIGTDWYNLSLSEKRANSVRNYLSKKGVNLERLGIKGFGKKMPTSSNTTKEGRQLNRRVEVKVFNGGAVVK